MLYVYYDGEEVNQDMCNTYVCNANEKVYEREKCRK